MVFLEPAPARTPCLRSVAECDTQRLIFTVGEYWRYYPSYQSEHEYAEVLDVLVRGALIALGNEHETDSLSISMDPYGIPWMEWLLALDGWAPSQPIDTSWDDLVASYARLMNGEVFRDRYAGVCTSVSPGEALRFCADAVIKNLAPASWIFCNTESSVVAYFHNTSSLGVCVPPRYGSSALLQQATRLGLVLQS